MSGPTCPTQSFDGSPEPGCDDLPVPGATILVLSPDRLPVGETNSRADGSFIVDLEPGTYLVAPQPVQGLLATPEARTVVVEAGETSQVGELRYDTGIR